MLVCPTCRQPLAYDNDKLFLICEKCRVKYDVIDDIPVLLADDAKKLDD
jgi:hypothetical protein